MYSIFLDTFQRTKKIKVKNPIFFLKIFDKKKKYFQALMCGVVLQYWPEAKQKLASTQNFAQCVVLQHWLQLYYQV